MSPFFYGFFRDFYLFLVFFKRNKLDFVFDMQAKNM